MSHRGTYPSLGARPPVHILSGNKGTASLKAKGASSGQTGVVPASIHRQEEFRRVRARKILIEPVTNQIIYKYNIHIEVHGK